MSELVKNQGPKDPLVIHLTDNAGIEKAIKDLEQRLRESRAALAAVEIVSVVYQLQCGLVTAEEMCNKVVDLALRQGVPLKPGDLDYISGYRVRSSSDMDAEHEAGYAAAVARATVKL